jgi:hypothetical protein
LNSRSCLTSILESEDTVIVAVLGIIYAAIRSAALFQILTAAIKRSISAVVTRQRDARAGRARAAYPHRAARVRVRRPSTGDTSVADNDKRWQDMTLDEQAVVIRQISGAVNGLQFRVQDLEEAVKALQRD